MGQPQGAVHQPGGGKAEGRSSPERGGLQLFRPKGQPGGVGTVGQSGVLSGEHHRCGEGIREAEQGAIHTIPGKLGRQLAAKGVGSQLGQQSRLPAQCGVLAAEACTPAAGLRPECLRQFRSRGGVQLQPDFAQTQNGHVHPSLRK